MRRANTKRDQDNHCDFEQLPLQKGKNTYAFNTYAFRWKITAMFGSDNCSQRLISKLMSQSDFPLSRFTIRGLSFVFIDASTFWPQAITYHTSVSHEEKKVQTRRD